MATGNNGSDERIERVSKLLEEASKLLRGGSSDSNSNAGSCSSAQDVVLNARNMLSASTSGGVYRRLSRSQRLRATAPYARSTAESNKTKPKPKKDKAKAMEFALIKCHNSEEEDEDYNLKWDSVVANGMVMLSEEDDEKSIREAIRQSLLKRFPIIGENDFDFVKVRQKKVSVLELGPKTEYNFSVVKKLAGQGLLYVKVKEGFQFLYTEKIEDPNDEDLMKSALKQEESHSNTTIIVPDSPPPASVTEKETSSEAKNDEAPKRETVSENNTPNENVLSVDTAGETSYDTYDALVSEINEKSLTNPIEILRFLQQKMIKGRALEVFDDAETSEGETNYIYIDRGNILSTTFAEFESINDFCKTFEVDFMGELAKDLGGPRKEWIRLMNLAIKEKYFDNGLRQFLAEEYYHVGIMMGIALLQNGQLPQYLPLDVWERLVITPSQDKCISNLQRGLNMFGLTRIFQRKPVMLHLLRPSNGSLTAKMLIKLLNPVFAPEGSTAHAKEKEIYALFVKYLRTVASGRREPLNLSSILIFFTGAAEEPVLGFSKQPTITFEHGQTLNQPESGQPTVSFIPTAHTCTNNLILPRGPLLSHLPPEEEIFQKFDLAFANTHFGVL